MKSILLSASLALGLGALAAAPAAAAPIVKSTVVATEASTDAACRTVERRVRSNGVTRITRTRQCDSYRPRYTERRVYRRGYGGEYRRAYGYGPRPLYRSHRERYDRPGISVRIN